MVTGAPPLEGRVAVITGASRGMGRAIALRLARDGADCVVMYRRESARAGEVVAEIERQGRRALALQIELGEPAGIGPAFQRIAEAFGRIDILVANAAATAFRPMLEASRVIQASANAALRGDVGAVIHQPAAHHADRRRNAA